jgi:hypothetical protein
LNIIDKIELGLLTRFQGIPLYAHVSDLAGTKKPYVLPVPFMNVLNGGYVIASHANSCSLLTFPDPTLVAVLLSKSS